MSIHVFPPSDIKISELPLSITQDIANLRIDNEAMLTALRIISLKLNPLHTDNPELTEDDIEER